VYVNGRNRLIKELEPDGLFLVFWRIFKANTAELTFELSMFQEMATSKDRMISKRAMQQQV